MQVFTGSGLGFHGSSLKLGAYGPKGTAVLGQGGDSVYVNAANGNLVVQQDDGFLAAAGIGIHLLQTYNSKGDRNTAWRFNVQSSIQIKGTANTAGSTLIRTAEDGHQSLFHYDITQKMYLPNDGGTERITYSQNEWVYKQGEQKSISYYNQNGQLVRMADRDGHFFSFTYVNGTLASIKDSSTKQQITWSFAQGLLQDMTVTSDGKVIHHLHYEYNEQQQLSKVSRDLGKGSVYWITYAYVPDTHWISTIQQSDGTSLHIDYDAQGRVSRTLDGAGRSSSYSYEMGKTSITNTLKETWTYYYDSANQLTGIDGPEQYRVRYQYENNRLSSVVQGSQLWRFAYNSQGDCIQIKEPNGQIIERLFDSEHRLLLESSYQNFDGTHHPIDKHSIRYVYDPLGHLRFTVRADGSVTEYRYDAQGRLTSSRTYLHSTYSSTSSSPDLSVTEQDLVRWSAQQKQNDISLIDYQYDWRGQLSEELHYALVNSQGVGISDGVLRTHYCYDAAGRLVEKSVPAGTNWQIIHYEYDDLGRLIQTRDNHNNSQSFAYDDLHQRIIQTDANGLQTIKLYDASGLLLSLVRLDTVKNYGSLEYQYDAAGRLIAETNELGLKKYYFYNHLGQVIGQVDTTGHVTAYSYNSAGLLIQTHQFQHNVSTQGWQQSIPDWFNVKPKATAQDRVDQVIYNQYQQIAFKINSEGAVIGYEYNAKGQILTATAYANRLKNYQADKLLSIEQIIISFAKEDRCNSYYYDSQGRLQAQIDSAGYATEYHYDRLGNLSETHQYIQAQTNTLTGVWSKDKPVAKSRDIHQYTFYDARGLKIGEIDGELYLKEYFYNEAGLLKEVCAYANKSPLSIIDREQPFARYKPTLHQNDHHTYYTYNDLGQLCAEKNQSGLLTSYAYDVMGNVIKTTWTDSKTQNMRQQYRRYDGLGRVVQSLDQYAAALLNKPNLDSKAIEAIWQAHSQSYEYNAAGLLISTTNALQQKTSYFYDESARLVYTINPDGAVEERRYTAFNQLESIRKYSQLLKPNEQKLTTVEVSKLLAALAKPKQDELLRYEYNVLGQVIATHSGSKGLVSSSYTTFAELAQTIQQIDAHHTRITAYQYDKRGLLSARMDDVGGSNKSKTMAYNAFGVLSYELDGRGGKRYFSFNKRGEQIAIYKESGLAKSIYYDAFGRIISETGYDSPVDIREFTYDDTKGLLTLTQADGHKVFTQFNAFGDKLSITDGRGFTTQYVFDAKGLVTEVLGPEGHSKQYRYDALGRLCFEMDAEGHAIAYTYDASNHLLSKIKDPKGAKNTTSYQYDGIGRTLTLTNPNSVQKVFTYDDQGFLITSCLDPQGLNLISQFSYDDRGLLIRQTELNPQCKNKVTEYVWDALGRRTAVIKDPAGLKLTTSYKYDANDNTVAIIDANGNATHYLFDVDNQCVYQINARGVVTEYLYNEEGLVTRAVTYAKAISLTAELTMKQLPSLLTPNVHDQYKFYQYDDSNRLTHSYDALGYCTRYTYDANNNVLSTIHYAVAVSLTELQQGNRPEPSAAGSRTEYMFYDGANQLRYKLVNNTVVETRYNKSGQVLSTTSYASKISLQTTAQSLSLEALSKLLKPSPQDRTVCYAYNALGLLIKELSPSGAATAYSYDALGNISSTTQYATFFNYSGYDISTLTFTAHAKDRSKHSLYDAAGRELYRISSEGRIIERSYDAVGNVLQEINHTLLFKANSYTLHDIKKTLEAELQALSTDFNYDATGRLVLQKKAGQIMQQFTYDAQGNVLSKTEANKAVWSYKYDAANQLIETISPAVVIGQTTRSISTLLAYDSFGNLIATVRDSNGLQQTINYEYDLKNQKIKTIFPNVQVNNAKANASNQREEVSKNLSEEACYNAFGQLIAARDKKGYWSKSFYDDSGLLKFYINSQGAVTSYTYTTFKEVATKTRHANSVSISNQSSDAEIALLLKASNYDRVDYYEYNKEGAVKQSSQKEPLSYNAKTKVYSKQLKPTKQTTYNAFGEPIKVAQQINETEWATTFYYYDNDGMKTAQIDAEHYLTTYSYNALGHVQDSTEWYLAVKQNTEENYTPVLLNAKDRTVHFTYDALGQLKSKTLKKVTLSQKDSKGTYTNIVKDLTTTYCYDALGHLVATTDPQGATAYCYYDSLGQLVAKVGPQTQEGRAATSYTYDALGNLLATTKWSAGASAANAEQFTLKGATALDQISKNTYDLHGRLLSQTDASNHTVFYSYDENGNLARSWQTMTNIDKSIKIDDKRYSYDSENNLLQSKLFKTSTAFKTEDAQYNIFGELVTKGINGVYTTRVDYDTQGRVWRSNSQGHYEIYLYDLLGRVTQVVTASNGILKSPNRVADLGSADFAEATIFDQGSWAFDLQRQNNTYDALGNLLVQTKEFSVLTSGASELKIQSRTQKYHFDRWGNMLRFTNARELVTNYEYNASNQLIKQELPQVTIMDEQGVKRIIKPTHCYYYDELGRAIGMMDANGQTVSKEYDAAGHLIKEIDAKGGVRQKHYNLLDQLKSTANELKGVTTYQYDKANRLIEVITPKTKQYYVYDEAGKLIKQTNGANESTLFWYDVQGNQTKQQNARGKITAYEYDDAGHKSKETDALGHSQTWAYNQQGLLQSHSDLGAHKTSYQYNANGLLVKEQSSAGKNVEYVYQGNGELLQYNDHANKEFVNYSYDMQGQLASRSSSRGIDNNGWLREIDYYSYDELGRLKQLSRKNPEDKDNRVPAPDKTLLNVHYDYDAVGNIRHTSVRANYTGYHPTQTEDYYLYDANNRMILNKGQLINNKIELSKSQGNTLAYDAAGNIIGSLKYEHGTMQQYAYQYNIENQLELSKKGGIALQAKLYDAAGRVIEERLFNNQGDLAQKNIMTYEKGALKAQSMRNHANQELSLTTYGYDDVDNLTYSNMQVFAQGNQQGYSLNHHYTYALWDNYLQAQDQAVRIENGNAYHGNSTRIYDVNGLLSASLDQQVGANGKTNSTKYWNSGVDGIKARADEGGTTHYLTFNHKTIGDLRLDNIKNEQLNIYGGFTPQGSQQSPNSAAQSTTEFLERTANEVEGVLPESTQDNLGAYTLQSGDSLESIALQVYGDSSLWYLIADANGLTCGKAETARNTGSLHLGQRLTIPPVATGQHHTSQTHKVLGKEYMIGMTAANTKTPLPPPPPPLPKSHHSLFSKIIVGIIATVATVLTAGIAGALAGMGAAGSSLFALGTSVLSGGMGSLSGTLAAGFASGFMGNIASQGMAKALNMQDDISLKSALVSGLISAATAGVLKGAQRIDAHQSLMSTLGNKSVNSQFNLLSAAETIEYNTTSQGVGLMAQQQKKFDWQQLGVSTLTAGMLGGSSGQKLQATLRKIDFNRGILASEFNSLAHAAVNSITGASFNALEVLQNNLGSAIGGGIVQGEDLLHDVKSDNGSIIENYIYTEKILDVLSSERLDIIEKKNDSKPPNIIFTKGSNPLKDTKNKKIKAVKKKNNFPHISQKIGNYNELRLESNLFESKSHDKYFAESGKYYEVKQAVQDTLDIIEPLKLSSEKDIYKGIYDINYNALFSSKGKGYRKEKIVSHSYYYKTPGSPIDGDASKELQMRSIDALITAAKEHKLNLRDTAHVLAIARHESGFNPYAAAGTTSACGLGQFINDTWKDYHYKTEDRWDIKCQAEALVKHFKNNQKKIIIMKLPETYIYKFHHDGSMGEYGGLEIGQRDVFPQISKISENLKNIF